MNINTEGQNTPSEVNSETHIKTHYHQIFKRQRQREPWKEQREANHHLQGSSVKLSTDFLSEAFDARKLRADIFKLLKENNC